MKKYIQLFALPFLLFSCTKDSSNEVSVQEDNLEEKITVRSKQDILDAVEEHIYTKKLSSKVKLNSSSIEIKAITSSTLGYDRNTFDTLLFAVKDIESKKNMLISANIDCEPIIAVLDDPNDSFDSSLKIDSDDPFQPFLLNAIKYNENPKDFTTEDENLSETLSLNTLAVVGAPGVNGKTIASELLPRVKVTWGQSQYPYNAYTPNNWPAGCVATAIAQAMSVTRHIQNFNGVALNWNQLVKMTNSSLASSYPNEANTIGLLLRQIGVAVNMSYGASGSSASTKDGVDILEIGNTFYALENKGAIKMVLDESPNNVIIISSRTKKSSWLGAARGSGHAYIVDGYEIYTDGTDLLHVNYGWNGYRNGYYLTRIWAPYFTDNTPSDALFPYSWNFYCIRKR